MVDEYFPIEFETDEAMEAELGETFPVPVRANYNQTDTRSLDYIIGREKILGKGDVPLDKGSAEGSVQTAQSKALSPYSFAFGTQDEEHLNVSGCKGYYVWKLDAKNLTIILAATEEEAQNTEDVPAPFTIGYAVDDKISLNCNYEYVDCSTITEIIDNAFRVDSLPPYYLENDATNYSKWSDKDTLFVNNTIYCTDKPNVGLADVGIGSHSEGVSNKSIGYGAHAEGSRNIAKGANSHTEGAENSAEYCSHAEGGGNKALGLYSHAEGHKTTASGNTAHAEGNETKASGSASHAEGEESTASGSCSHAEGDETTASGNASHAEGDQTIANGMASHVEGCSAKALGWASHAEGKESTASGDYTHAEGSNTTASKSASHAEGDQTIANGVASHAEGHYAKALGWASHAEGLGTIAKETAQHVEGKYNADEPTALHIVGCGTSDTERDNCFSTGVTTDGQKYIKVGDTMITEAQLIKLLALLG